MIKTTSSQLTDTLLLGDNETVLLGEDIVAPIGNPAVDIVGDNVLLSISPEGSIKANDNGNTVVLASGNNDQIINAGTIAGDFNGISASGDNFTLINTGQISSNSRAVDITDGDGSFVLNAGEILGTGNQRNGTLYVDGTVDDFRLFNAHNGVIDAGDGNLGDAISVQVGAADDPSNENINIVNTGLLQGRGDGLDVFNGGRVTANGSSGLRFFNGSGTPEATVTGSVVNSGVITAEVNVGFLGGLVTEDGVAFEGTISNGRKGLISGPRNGLYIGNADHDLRIFNRGRIESGSRAVNIDGSGVNLRNFGEIIGTGNQRNGTIYTDATATDFSIVNESPGVIDAGLENQGTAISLQVGDRDGDIVNGSIQNQGLIQGRGDAVDSNLEGDGIRLAAGVEGSVTFDGNIVNMGEIIATDDGIDLRSGVVLDGNISNQGTITATDTGILLNSTVQGNVQNSGEISGGTNGISSAGDNLRLINSGAIASDSRAVDITDGDNLLVRNSGEIIGTGNQRNGTLYVDGTVDDLRVVNASSGTIDAGSGNLGDGISVQVGATGDLSNENITLSNQGLIQGRGDGPEVFNGGRVAANGSSGVRFFNGVGETDTTITGSIVNSGTITSEVNVGFLGGVVVEDGVGFEGRIINTRSGLISGPRNGLYIGNAEHDLSIVNRGEITSGSRVVNLDGDNVSFINTGSVLGTDDQRNGTVYIDGTGDNIEIINSPTGSIDAGDGNSGSGISVQVGAVSNGVTDSETSASIVNGGLIQGRGSNNVPAGVRLFVGSGLETATFTGDISNTASGQIISAEDAGILIGSGVIFDGTITNNGAITGGNGLAIDATGALGAVNVVNNGELNGDVQLGLGNDSFTQNSVQVINRIDGGEGIDTIDFSGQTASIVIDLDLNTPPAGAESQDGAVLEAPGGNVITEVDDFENVIGSNFDDLILGNNEINNLEGGLGNDTIHSFGGPDTLNGGEGTDLALFSAGPGVEVDLDEDGNATSSLGDTLISFENINGSVAGNDTLSGNGLANILNGQGGNDILNGEAGNDTLLGGTGNDELIGGAGEDLLIGGLNNDILTGGFDQDTFQFGTDSGVDIVTDFTTVEDRLNVSTIFNNISDILGIGGAATQVGTSTLIDFGNDNAAILLNVSVSDLTNDNFIFGVG